MRIFKINPKIEIVCEWKKTRTAFKHEATLFKNGIEQIKSKICYINRTWERFEFQSVLIKIVNEAEKNKIISAKERQECIKYLEEDRTDWSDFKAVTQAVKIGEVLCNTQKDKNDWNMRMIKAGLEHKGLIIPEDWNKLDEDTKQKRLDGVIKLIGEKK